MPSVYLTGDIHHSQGHIPQEASEWEYAGIYEKILKKFQAVGTLFVTGRCLYLHESFWKDMSERGVIEIGGHTYWAFPPRIFQWVFGFFLGSRYGPRAYQRWDIRKTRREFERLGIPFKVWRTHAYALDRRTDEFLEHQGISVISNLRFDAPVQRAGKLCHLPINVFSDDQIHLYYEKKDYKKMRETGKKVLERISEKIEKGEDIVTQLHPLCMKILDDFETFHCILERLSRAQYDFRKVTDVL